MTDGRLTDEQIAWVIHEAHRALQMTDPLHPNNRMPAPPWVTMNPQQKETVKRLPRLLRQIKVKMGTAGWALIHDRVLAEEAHAHWVQWMGEHGWAWGEEKDPARRTHPDLTDWARLSPYEQSKTLQAVAIAKVHL